MRRKWFSSSKGPPVENRAEVEISHFASILGLTTQQYSTIMMKKIESGHLLDLLKTKSSFFVESWIIEEGLFDSREFFCIMFRLSLNKPQDDALFCICRVEKSEDEYLLQTIHAQHGFCDIVPDGIDLDEMKIFEVMFCDLETDMFGDIKNV